MKPIRKSPPPQSLSLWVSKRGKRLPQWKNFDRSVKDDLFYSLLAEQGYTCGYCGRAIHRRDCHIEHFRPKSVYPDLTYDYNNLIASCQGEHPEKPRVPLHCGHKKSNWFDADLMVSPLDPDCDRYFRYLGSGEIQAADVQPAAAQATIDRLRLDIDKLRAMRRSAIDAALAGLDDLTTDEIAKLAQGYAQIDPKGRFIPFSAAITYTLKQLI